MDYRRLAGRKQGRSLVPVFGRRVPQVYLGATQQSARPQVYLSEPGDAGAGTRLKWLASTCLAGVVGVCIIGITIYGSMNTAGPNDDFVSSIRRASLAALKPVQGARIVKDRQTAAGQKSDRIFTTAAGLATRHIIHDSVVQYRGSREYIGIKPYARIVARLATDDPNDADRIPPFNPFKLFANHTPIAEEDGSATTTQRDVVVTMSDIPALPREDGLELRAPQVAKLVSRSNQAFAEAPFAMRPAIMPEGTSLPIVKAAYRPFDLNAEASSDTDTPGNTTVIEKADDSDAGLLADAESKRVKVERGDTLMSILEDAGSERWQAKAIADAMAPIFPASSLRPGQEILFTLVPAPSDTGQMEPLKVSVFSGDQHEVTIARNEAGEYVASNEPIDLASTLSSSSSQHASLYNSFYEAALSQNLSPEMIVQLLRVHSYDVDFKRPVRAGDSFEVFCDLRDGDRGRDTEAGELLFTAMTVSGERHEFYRFRTPDGVVDYYDQDGNSARKFLMRQPVKGSRFTSGFGMRNHPLARYKRMHTGIDWAAPRGTPILAAGSGVVEDVERRSGYGNYVRIRHANGYKTAYGHIDHFAEGLRPGVHVEQGQVIAYVGSTGVSTGPHLHFEVLANGRHVDPMTIHVPRGRQLTGKLLAEFAKERSRIDELMQRSPVTTQVASISQQAR